MYSMIEAQNKDVEKAIIGAGPFELRPEYKEYEICPADWFKLSSSKIHDQVKAFLNAPLKPSRPTLGEASTSASQCSISFFKTSFN